MSLLSSSPPPNLKRPRDQRLDFFRGLCLFFILIAHTHGNGFIEFIPARFGFSDATEIFVFCSGMASAIAFGRVFDTHGMLLGSARIAYRIWQVYWAHLAVFLVFAALVFGYDLYKGTEEAARAVNLHHVAEDPRRAFIALLSLTYLPWFLDILPMYLVILALVPLAVWLRRISPALTAAASLALWALAQAGFLGLPGDPWAGTPWYFNPFGWQLLFFLGFAFMMGWLPAPPLSRRLMLVCAVVVIAAVPFAAFRISERWGALQSIAEALQPWADKGAFGPLRLAHFLALAYLAYAACGQAGVNLKGRFVAVIRKVGTQSLPVFLTGIILARATSYLYQEFGEGLTQDLIFNALGICTLIGVALLTAWFRADPWGKPPATKPVEQESAAPNRAEGTGVQTVQPA